MALPKSAQVDWHLPPNSRPVWTNTHVYVYDIARNLGTASLVDLGRGLDPTFSPDGLSIAFSDFDTGQIWIMNTDGTGRQQISTGAAKGIPALRQLWGGRIEAYKMLWLCYHAHGGGHGCSKVVMED